MTFARIDGYLLGEPVSKLDAVAELLAERSADAAAAPFYRALDIVGAQAADEALIALRLILAGHPAGDDAVRRLRALAGIARSCTRDDMASVRKIRKRDAAVLDDLSPETDPELGAAARRAYVRTVATGSVDPPGRRSAV